MYSDIETGEAERGPRDLWPEVRARLRAFDLLNEDDSPKADGPTIRVMERFSTPEPRGHGRALIIPRTGKIVEVSAHGFGDDGQMGRIVLEEHGTHHAIAFDEIDNLELP